MDKARWGVLGTADIFTDRVMTGIRSTKHVEVVAIASRSLEKAQAVAADIGIPKAYGSYDELIADPDVDIVYNPLPNHMHVPWSLKVLDAGKHLLCEKPLAPTAAEAQVLLDAARKHPDLKVMEGYMFRHHPQWPRARKLIAEGRIGELRTVQAFFSFTTLNPKDIRNIPEYGGGALLDIGGYSISHSRYIYDAEPTRVAGFMDFDPEFGTDRLTSGILEYEHGIASFTCSTQLSGYTRVNILGTKGRIEIENPFGGPPEVAWRMWLHSGRDQEEIVFDICNQYALEFDAFSLAVLNNTDVYTPLEDGIANLKVIDAIRESAKSGAWVQVS